MIREKEKLYDNLKQRNVNFLNLENLMPAEDSLVILEKNIKIPEPVLSSQMPWTQLLKRKAVCLNQVLNTEKCALLWKKMPKRSSISKKEKRASGFKADWRLTCFVQIDFLIRTSLIYKAAKPTILFFFFWPCHTVCVISVPRLGIEPAPRQKPGILTTRPPGNSWSPLSLKGKKINTSCHSFGCTTRRPGQWEHFSGLVPSVLCPWSPSTLQ